MGKKHDKKREGNSRKIWIGLLIATILILLLAIGLVIAKKGKLDNPVISKVSEMINKEEKEDSGTTSLDEEDGAESEDKPQELINSEVAQTLVQKNAEGSYKEDEAYTSGDIVCEDTAVFSGQYVEDGRDELVKNVAAILVTNKSDNYLEMGVLIYEIDGKEATFVVTGLPAGKTAWVMEKSRMTVASDAEFKYQGSTTSFRDDIVAASEMIEITADGNMLIAKNKSEKDMENIVVYYKVKHDDGNYFGGITYVVDFGEVKAGEAIETLAGHYLKDSTDIVRMDWREK